MELGTALKNHYKSIDAFMNDCMLVANGHCSEKHTIIRFKFACATLCEPYLRQHDEAHKEGEEADPEEEELPTVFTSEQSGMHVDYRCHEALNAHKLMGQARQEVICSYFGSNVSCKSDMTSIAEEEECVFTHLAVEPQEHNHDEEKCGPQSGERHHAHSAGVSDEGQARTCKDQNATDAGFSRRSRLFNS